MKKLSKLYLVAPVVLALAVGVTGCATDNARRATAMAKSGVVCPECRTVTLGPFPSSAEWRGGSPATVQRHECPGCRGVVTLSPGPDGYRHECSVCKQTPFSCSIIQR